jgi:hypothetical protein
MQTFYIIIQKNLKAKNIFLIDAEANLFGFWKNVFESELHSEKLILDGDNIDNLSVNECNRIFNTNNITKQSFYFMISATYNKLKDPYYAKRIAKVKYNELDKIMSNIFISTDVKEKFLYIFGKSQKMYHAFSRLAFIYKYNKANIKVKSDLYMNDILPDQNNTITIFQNDAKYIFIIQDLIKIIHTALTNAPGFFIDSLACKNPYTNIPFNRSTLYHIYFQMKSKLYVVPDLIHRFFLANFNRVVFKLDNETLIKEHVFKNYIKNTPPETICIDIRTMLKEHRFTKKLYIDEEFPEKKLVEIFSPYLELYYQTVYCHSTEKIYLNKDILYKKLQGFYFHNKCFGRKTFTKEYKLGRTRPKYIWGFNQIHMPFNKIQIKTWENLHEDWSLINPDFNEIEDEDNDTEDNDTEDNDAVNDNDHDSNAEDDSQSVNTVEESNNNSVLNENNENNDEEDDEEIVSYIAAIELEIPGDNSIESDDNNNFFNYDSETDSIS